VPPRQRRHPELPQGIFDNKQTNFSLKTDNAAIGNTPADTDEINKVSIVTSGHVRRQFELLNDAGGARAFLAAEADKTESDNGEPGTNKAETGDDTPPPPRGKARGEGRSTKMTKDEPHLRAQKMDKAQKVLRSKMQPPSTIPCQYRALVGKSANPRRTMDYEEAGVPQHIASIGSWHRGHCKGYGNQPLPPNKEATSPTCSACGDHGHDFTRCTKRIIGTRKDFWYFWYFGLVYGRRNLLIPSGSFPSTWNP
jgi:hypothetical protein